MKLQTIVSLLAATCHAFPIANPAQPQSNNPSVQQQYSKSTQYSHNWSGSVLSDPPSNNDAFTSVSATLTVPKVTLDGPETYQAASAWVGIDGATVSDAILQTGLDFGFRNGKPYHNAWYQWFPAASVQFDNLDISEGDVITASVHATSPTSGECLIENKSTGQKASETVSANKPTSTLSGKNAEWIVEDFLKGQEPVALVDFGEVWFEGCEARTRGGESVGVSGGRVFQMVQDKRAVTEVVVVDDGTLDVKHA